MTILNDTTVVIFTSTDWKLYEIINHNTYITYLLHISKTPKQIVIIHLIYLGDIISS